MAKFTVSLAQVAIHAKKLEASVVDTVEFECGDTRYLEVITDGDIYYTMDGSTPTVAGQNCRRIPSAGVDLVRVNEGAMVVLKLISSSTPIYSIQQEA